MDSPVRLGSLSSLSDRVSVASGDVFDRFQAWRWWLQVGLVWLLGRLFTVAVVLTVARQQGPNPWSGTRPRYLDYIDGWDAGWYHKVFDEGYPSVLPRAAAGEVVTNQWAFYPVLPGLAKLVHLLTGAPWTYVAPVLSTAASLALCLLMYRLFLRWASAPAALTAVALFSFQPAAPVLQFGYAESVGLLLLVAVLWCLERERYLAAVPLVLVASLTRPVNAALTLTLVVLLVVGLRGGTGPAATGSVAGPGPAWRVKPGLAALTVVTGLSTFIWPTVAALVTGNAYAYFETEASWHGNSVVLPFELWATVGMRLFGPVLGIAAPMLFVAGLVLLLTTRAVRRVGLVLHVWTASYLLYLLAVGVPNGSLFRLLLPTFPLVLAASLVSNARPYRAALVVLCLAGQVVWVAWLWHWSGTGPHGALEANP